MLVIHAPLATQDLRVGILFKGAGCRLEFAGARSLCQIRPHYAEIFGHAGAHFENCRNQGQIKGLAHVGVDAAQFRGNFIFFEGAGQSHKAEPLLIGV